MLRNVSRLPCLFKHVALMPDAHLGKGSMVGSVVATKEAVIPATVGVDIGCGMMAVKTPFKSGILDGKLKELRLKIEEAIPTGFSAYKESVDESSYWEGWNEFKRSARGRSRSQSESDEATGHTRWRQPLHRSLSRH
jgi:tRNA-splicing ligase RtcB